MHTLNTVSADRAQPAFITFKATTKATKSQTRPNVELGIDGSPWAGHDFLRRLIDPSLTDVPGHLARKPCPLKSVFDGPHSLSIVMLHDPIQKYFSRVIEGLLFKDR